MFSVHQRTCGTHLLYSLTRPLFSIETVSNIECYLVLPSFVRDTVRGPRPFALRPSSASHPQPPLDMFLNLLNWLKNKNQHKETVKRKGKKIKLENANPPPPEGLRGDEREDKWKLIFNLTVSTWFYWALPSLTAFYWVLPKFTGFDWVLLDFTGFYRVLLGFTGFYLVLLDFTEFYWSLLCLTGLFWVFT